jgi:hypothetical protein
MGAVAETLGLGAAVYTAAAFGVMAATQLGACVKETLPPSERRQGQ